MIYDLLVIGGGPAGYLAAERAGHAGMSVLLIEKNSVGGVCLNEGCIPSKALLYSAKIADNASHGDAYGVRADNVRIDHAAVIARKRKVVGKLVAGVKASLTANKVTIVEAEAVIEGRNAEGFVVSAGGVSYTAGRLLLATGSVPVLPPIKGAADGLKNGFVLTNREILELPAVPPAMVIIGGGVIGLEMASYYTSAGSRVTVIEMLDHIAGQTDLEIAVFLQKEYEKKGVTFILDAKVTEILSDGVVYEKNGASASCPADKALMSIGRRAFTDGLGLEKLGVEIERGAVKTDAQGRTNVAGVFAAGDVNGKYMLAHAAYREAEVCVNTMLGKRDNMRYSAIPSVIYTNPEVGGVGETEQTAAEKGISFTVKKLSMKYSGRFLAENDGDGICKVLADKSTGIIIGVHAVGPYASEFIWGAAAMIEQEMRIDDAKEIVFPHPTVSEIIRETIFTF